MPLTTSEIASLRSEVNAWLVDTCDLYRETRTTDDFGGQTEAETLVQSGIRCSIQSGVAHEQVVANIGTLRSEHIYTVTVPAETDVRVQDNLVLTTKANLKVRVQAVFRPETNELMRPVVATTEL